MSSNGFLVRKQSDAGLFEPLEEQGFDERPAKRRRTGSIVGLDSNDSSQQSQGASKPQVTTSKRPLSNLRMLSMALQGHGEERSKPETAETIPLPTRPWKQTRSRKKEDDIKPTHRARALQEVSTTPYSMEEPTTTEQMSGRPAGYFPWMGTHPEDVLSETSVRNGFQDKGVTGLDKETNTARAQLFPILKHRAGTEGLSALFSFVLEAKNRHGLIKTSSTFKPPPRVTLAEAKRKSWITDLADSTVPLRKLSRTIPQGIRGQILLEQCLQHNVPLSRAIWFAKCVGANEIRTLKRKGATFAAAFSEEHKWLKEWTRNIQQFLESIVSQIGQQDWKASTQYAVRLVTRLYLENLVDRDNYLDWLVSAFAKTPDGALPFWLMFVHIYRQDITKFRKKGRRFAEALITKYEELKDSTHVLAQTLLTKLGDAIRAMAQNRAHCMLLPDLWPKIRETVKHCLADDATFARLDRNNERCMGSNKGSYLSNSEPQDLVIETLDSVTTPVDFVQLSEELHQRCSEHKLLMSTCLTWATSKWRSGSMRIYLVARLLRKWQRQGLDVDSVLLELLEQAYNSPADFDSSALKHLMADLTRSRVYSVSRYLQWLNVRGLPHSGSVLVDQDTEQQRLAGDTEVLLDLPVFEKDGHVFNMRNAMLARAGLNLEKEVSEDNLVLEKLQHGLAQLSSTPGSVTPFDTDLARELSKRNWIFRSRVSTFLRGLVVDAVRKQVSIDPTRALQLPTLDYSYFNFIRHCLEAVEDIAVLADVVGLCCCFDEEQLQATLVETISRHAQVFSAIGALEPLRTKLYQIYMQLRNIKPTMPLFATALLDLCLRYPAKSFSTRLLQQDLIKGDRGRAVAACSPFSDGIAESLQQAETTFIDDFEAVLQSEPSMNEQTMSRLFALLTERIEKQSLENEDMTFVFCQLMARLRLCRKSQGDELLRTWLRRVLSAYPLPLKKSLVDCLVDTGCLPIDNLTAVVETLPSFNAAVLLPANSPSSEAARYSVHTKWLEFAKRCPGKFLNLFGSADKNLVEFLDFRAMVLKKVNDGQTLTDSSREILAKFLSDLLHPPDAAGDGLKTSLNTLSLPFVKKHLALNATDDVEASAAAVNQLVATTSAGPRSTRFLGEIVHALDPEVASLVRQAAEQKVMDLMMSSMSDRTEPSDSLSTAMEHLAAVCEGLQSPSSKTLAQLVERLSYFLKTLGSTGTPAASSVPTSPTSTFATQMPSLAAALMPSPSPADASPRPTMAPSIEHMNNMLQLLCLCRPLSQPTGTQSGKQSQSDYIKILALLTSIITHPSFANLVSSADPSTDVLDFAYDVLATFSDILTPEAHTLVCKIVKEKVKNDTRDGRLRWLFGNVSLLGSDMQEAEEMGRGLYVQRKGENKGDWKPRVWEVIQANGQREGDLSLGLGMFGARRV